MPLIRIDAPFELRLPPEAVRRMEAAIVLRILAGWPLLGLLALLVKYPY